MKEDRRGGSRRELILETGSGRVRALENEPLRTSALSGWSGFFLEHHQMRAVELNSFRCLNHVLILQVAGRVTLEWEHAGEWRRTLIEPGCVTFFPSYQLYSTRSADVGEFVSVSLEPSWLARVAVENGAAPWFELVHRIGAEDGLARELVLSLKRELEGGSAEGLSYAEGTARLLSLHLLRHYAMPPIKLAGLRPGLSEGQLRRAMQFVEEHLGEELSLSQLAGSVGLSAYHFARSFKKATGLSPHEYVVRSRVARARELLVGNFESMATVAVEVGFCDQSHLTRHFKRVYGMTPGTFARQISGRQISGRKNLL